MISNIKYFSNGSPKIISQEFAKDGSNYKITETLEWIVAQEQMEALRQIQMDKKTVSENFDPVPVIADADAELSKINAVIG